MRFISVDFPDPDGPMMATYSPLSIEIDTPGRAWILLAHQYVFHRSSVSISAMGMDTTTAAGQFHITSHRVSSPTPRLFELQHAGLAPETRQ